MNDAYLLQDQLLTYFQEKLPAHKNALITHFAAISDGWETEVYAFDLDAQKLILRAYPGDSENAGRKAAHEFDSLKKLHAMGYPVPEVFYQETDPAWIGKPFIIMARIEGIPMGRAFEGNAEDAPITPFCQLFVDLHTLDEVPFLPPEAATLDLTDPYLFLRLKLDEGRLVILDTFKRYDFAPVLDWLESQIKENPCERLAVIHGDFHPYNILVTADGTPYVIDWGNLAVGDPRFDLAWTLVTCGAQWREPILQEYTRLLGQPVTNIAYFEVITAVKRLFEITLSLSGDAEALGMRAEGAALIKQQAAHIRYVYGVLQAQTGLAIQEVEALIRSLE